MADGTTQVAEPRRHRRRGLVRRAQILEAALVLIARDGGGSVTLRDVAAEAGVPLTATAYYFDSKEELIREAWRLHADRETQRVREATSAIGSTLDREQLARQLADFIHQGLHEARANLLAEYELLLHAARDPELAELARVWHAAIREQLQVVLEDAGSSDPRTDARLIAAATAGLEVDNLSTPMSTPARKELEATMRRLLDGLLER